MASFHFEYERDQKCGTKLNDSKNTKQTHRLTTIISVSVCSTHKLLTPIKHFKIVLRGGASLAPLQKV